jgi:hypothetical protein
MEPSIFLRDHVSNGTCIINPGSVGQPKDGDPRAAYAVWDGGKIELKRPPMTSRQLLGNFPRSTFITAMHVSSPKCSEPAVTCQEMVTSIPATESLIAYSEN